MTTMGTGWIHDVEVASDALPGRAGLFPYFRNLLLSELPEMLPKSTRDRITPVETHRTTMSYINQDAVYRDTRPICLTSIG